MIDPPKVVKFLHSCISNLENQKDRKLTLKTTAPQIEHPEGDSYKECSHVIKREWAGIDKQVLLKRIFCPTLNNRYIVNPCQFLYLIECFSIYVLVCYPYLVLLNGILTFEQRYWLYYWCLYLYNRKKVQPWIFI